MLDQTVGFVGAGQMARALARGFTAKGLVEGARVVVFDPAAAAMDGFAELVAGCRRAASNREVADKADVLFLAVKPQSLPAVLAELEGAVSQSLVVSVVAGATIARLAAGLGSQRVVRVMPNTPCLIGQGASGYARAGGASAEDGELAARLLGAVGLAIELDESLLDAVTGLSGSGPAYVYTMIEALSDGGVRMGLPRAAASSLAAQTVLGAAAMVLSAGEHPAVLKDRVASPGGTTIAGLQALEDRGFRSALIAAVEAATRRSRQLGGESDPGGKS